jgi:mannose-6-phosphate isomerase-like protein (cupin superfamily)
LSGQEEMNEMKVQKITLAEKFERLKPGDYAMGLVAKMNNYEIKVVRFKGIFVWHSHADTDETFIILDGTMVMSFRDETVELKAGDMIVIPRGVEHRPSSAVGYKALLIEPEGVPNTGGVQSHMVIQKVEWV